MNILWALILFIPITSLIAVVSRRKSRAATRKIEPKKPPTLQDVAAELGLAADRHVARGTLDGFVVTISATAGEVRLTIDGGGRIPRSLSLDHSNPMSRSVHHSGSDVAVGDRKFDALVQALGDEVEIVALMDVETRHLVLQEGIGFVRDGQVLGWWPSIDAGLASRLRRKLHLASRLAMLPEDSPERLARNAISDPIPEVRLRNLLLLQTHFGGSEAAQRASRSLLSHADPRLRLHAAMHMEGSGLDTVIAIVDAPHVDTAVRLEALRHLAASQDAARAVPVLERTLASTRGELFLAAIEAFGTLRYRPALERLLALGATAYEATTAAVAASVARLGDPAAEPVLLRWLETRPDFAKIAAARALGDIGTITAVEPLLDCVRDHSMDTHVKHAAREAIARIQSRLGDVEAGRLSLSELTQRDGALSLANETGGLSLAAADLPTPPEVAAEAPSQNAMAADADRPALIPPPGTDPPVAPARVLESEA